jgi:hypothetical protein
MSNQDHHRNARDLEVHDPAQDRYKPHQPPPHITPKSDTQGTNRPLQMAEHGSFRGPRPPQPQPRPQDSVNTRKNTATSSSIEPQPSHLGNLSASNTDTRLYRDNASSQSVNSDGSLGSTRDSGHRRPGSIVDMSGIELPFPITGDEYDLPHSPRTYALLDAVANKVFDSGKDTFQIPVSRFQRPGHSTQMSDLHRRLAPSGAHPASGTQAPCRSTHETKHAVIDKVKTQSTSDHSHPHGDGQQAFPPPGSLLVPHQRQVAADVRTGHRVREGPFAAVGGRSVLNGQISNLGIDSPPPALMVSSAPEKELVSYSLVGLSIQLIGFYH